MRFILSILTLIVLALTVSAHAPPAASPTSLTSAPDTANLQHVDLLKRQAQSISLPPTFRTSIISTSSSVNSSSTVFQSSNSKPKSSSSKKSKKKKKLKGGPLAGIIVGVIVAVIILLVLLWFAKKSWDKRKAKKEVGYAAPVEQGGGTLADVK